MAQFRAAGVEPGQRQFSGPQAVSRQCRKPPPLQVMSCEDGVSSQVRGGGRPPAVAPRPDVDAPAAALAAAAPVREMAPSLRREGTVAERVGIVRCEPRSASLARDLVAKRLAALGLVHLADAAELLVSELVGNAIKYAAGRILLITVHPAGHGVRVAVTDGSRALPTPVRAGDEDEGGRGLALVEALARTWGAVPLPLGKRVWFEL